LLAEQGELMHGTKWYQDLDSAKQELFDSFIQESIEGAHEILKSDISRKIEQYKTSNAKLRAERPRRQTTPDTIKFGVYLAAGKVIRVYPGRQSGRMLAAEITADGPVYLGAAFRFVKPDQRLSHDEAAKYGAQFGICCVCAAPLTDPVSVAAGIGPICSGRYNS
jgi:urease beta subunit